MEKNENISETEHLWVYKNGVAKNNLNPNLKDFLLEKKFLGYAILGSNEEETERHNKIETGRYAFLQGLMTESTSDNTLLFSQAAEALFLESLWQEQNFENDDVFIRILTEDSKNVFQLFRKIKA